MALIVKCRKCKRRIPEEAASCPFCGSGDLRYIIDYWPGGRRGGRKQTTLPASIGTAREARLYERAAVELNSKKRRTVTPARSDMAIRDIFDDYLEWFRLHRQETTWREVSSSWRHSLDRILGHVLIYELTSAHLAMFQKTRKLDTKVRNGEKVQVSNRTVNKELDYLSGFLKWCRRSLGMDVPEIRVDRLPCKRPVPVILSPNEAARIIEAAEPFYRGFFLCLYTLALRFAEVQTLTWPNVDFANRTIRVRQKGGTDKVLPMHPWLEDELKALHARRNEKTDMVFPSPRTRADQLTPPQPLHNVRKALARAVAKAGVKKRVYPHLFRHSVATHFLANDVNLRTIQKYLGHSQVATTEWYTHVAVDHMRSAADGLFREGLYRKSSDGEASSTS